MPEQSFFLVWNPDGAKPPSYRHATREAAQQEAKRLAREFAPSEFYVLQAVSKSRQVMVLTEELAPPPLADTIPF